MLASPSFCVEIMDTTPNKPRSWILRLDQYKMSLEEIQLSLSEAF